MHIFYKTNFLLRASLTLLIYNLVLIPLIAANSKETSLSSSHLATNATNLGEQTLEKKKNEDNPDFEGVVNSHEMNQNASSSTSKDSDSQCVEDAIMKGSNGEILSSEVDICKSVSVQCLHDSLQKLLEDPTKQVSGQDYACILLNLLQRNTEYATSITNLESNLQTTQDHLQALIKTVDSHPRQFIPVEKLAELEKMEKSSSTRHSQTVQRVTVLEKQVLNLTEVLASKSSEDSETRKLFAEHKQEVESVIKNLNSSLTHDANAFEAALTELNQIGGMWSEIHSSVQDLQTRNSQNEVEIVNKITEINTNLTHLTSALESQTEKVVQEKASLREEFLSSLSKSGEELKEELVSKIEACQKSTASSISNLTSEWEGHKSDIKIEMENATRNLKTMLRIPFQAVEQLETELASRLEQEVKRATTAESSLASSILNSTSKQEINFKAMLEKEVKRSESRVERVVQSSISGVKSSLERVRQDLEAGISIESLRAKGTEDQLSSIIGKEVEGVRKEQGELNDKLVKLGDVLIQESKRALQAEEGLEKKISDEEIRALTTESGLLDNVNQELKRASEREGELHDMCIKNGEKIDKTVENLASLNELVDTEIESCNTVVNINTNLNEKLSKVAETEVKLAELEMALNSRVDSEIQRALRVEADILQEISTLANKTEQVEARIVTEIVAGSEKISSALTSQREALMETLDQGLHSLRRAQEGNWTQVGEKLGTFTTLMDSQVEKVGSYVREIETNFTVHLLTLADEMDKKLDAFSRKVDARFDRLESDVSELNAFKNVTIAAKKPTSTPTATSPGGVFNRIVGFFGGNRRSSVATPKNSTLKKSPGSKILKGDNKKSEDENDNNNKEDDLVSKRLRVEDVFSEENDDDIISDGEAELISGLSSSLLSRKRSNNAGKAKSSGGARKRSAAGEIPIMVQRSNSRIRNMYG